MAEGRHYSLGFDLTLVMGMNAQELIQFLTDVQQLYCRLLTFPLVTVAAANGEEVGEHEYMGVCMYASMRHVPDCGER